MNGPEPPANELGQRTSGELVGDAPLLLIPLGATEQHGPHLPLATDTIIATAWAAEVCTELNTAGGPGPGPAGSPAGRRATVGPAVPYGSSGEHQDFPGTLSIGQDALAAIITELVRSSSHTFPATVLLSGHAGNLQPLTAAAARLNAEGRRTLALVPTWPVSSGQETDAHAGRTETSLMLHLAPDLVRSERLEAGATAPLSQLLPEMEAGSVAAVSPNGVLGDPFGASADEGRALLVALVARTVTRIERWLDEPSQYDSDPRP